jgi:pyrroline-5-carboxylate reductase
MGITGYTAADGISFSQLISIERLLNSTGRSVYLENEELLDGVTAFREAVLLIFTTSLMQ